MDNKIIEHNELIANRKAPGDNWVLVGDNVTHPSLTDALQVYFEKSGFKGAYRLDPLDSKLYAIRTETIKVERVEPKTYSIYGDVFRQGV
jgi:hypothetical protein